MRVKRSDPQKDNLGLCMFQRLGARIPLRENYPRNKKKIYPSVWVFYNGAPESAQNNTCGPIRTQHDFPHLLCEGEMFLQKYQIISEIPHLLL